MRLFAALAFLPAALALAPNAEARPKERPMHERFRDYRPGEAPFRCQAPAAWREQLDEREARRLNVFGSMLVGPRGGDPRPPAIELRYYSPKNPIFPRPEDYLKAQAEPRATALEGETIGPIESFPWGRREARRPRPWARRLIRETFEPAPHRAMARPIPMKEEHVVAAHGDGFVVLLYVAPRSSFRRHRPAFQRALDTFEPLP